jgi:hypothetical protein
MGDQMALPVFAVTFRIAKTTADEKRDYDERYEAIEDDIRSFADGLVWDETTSFLLFDGKEGTETADIIKKVEANKWYRKEHEKLLVIRLYEIFDRKSGKIAKPNTLTRILNKLHRKKN